MKIHEINSTYTQILLTVLVSLLNFMVGYSSAYTSTTLETKVFKKDIKLTGVEKSWIISFLWLFAVLGGFCSAYLMDMIGRKVTLIIAGFVFAVSYLFLGFARHKWYLYLARLLAGIAVGMVSVTVPIYVCEVTNPKLRGNLGLLPTAVGNFGILLCYLLGGYLEWKVLALMCLAPNFIFLTLALFLPETPAYYLLKGEEEKCLKVLKFLYKKDSIIEETLEELKSAQVVTKKCNIKAYVQRATVKPIAILIGIMMTQQLTGINAVIAYTVHIFKKAKTSISSYLSTDIIGVVNFLSTFLSTILITCIGRKTLLIISDAIVVVMLVILGVYFYHLENHYDVSNFEWVPLTALILYVVGFSLGLGPIPWLIMGEILPRDVLECATLVLGINFLCSFAVMLGFVDISEYLGLSWTFWIFGGLCTIGAVFILITLPETRGKSLEDIRRRMSGMDEVGKKSKVLDA